MVGKQVYRRIPNGTVRLELAELPRIVVCEGHGRVGGGVQELLPPDAAIHGGNLVVGRRGGEVGGIDLYPCQWDDGVHSQNRSQEDCDIPHVDPLATDDFTDGPVAVYVAEGGHGRLLSRDEVGGELLAGGGFGLADHLTGHGFGHGRPLRLPAVTDHGG